LGDMEKLLDVTQPVAGQRFQKNII
jgi:hypothetical protein